MKNIFVLALLCLATSSLWAQQKNNISSPNSHAPIGIMGDHTHKKGEFMFSYRFMDMAMKDNLKESENINSDQIATSEANRFFGNTGQPPTLRVVPQNMQMNMHMLGMMYAPSDKFTLMLMGSYLNNRMELLTYQGMMGTNTIGTFNSKSSGFSDIKISALVNLFKKESSKMHLNFGFSLPTGSIKETGTVLTPMNMKPEVRMPYPMQLGSGTVDWLPGITYVLNHDKLVWGSQFMATIRLNENSENYKLGNKFQLHTWLSYQLASWISASARVSGQTLGEIRGMDPNIMLPVQTADPARQGGQVINGALGINLIGTQGIIRNQRLAIEVGTPFYQNLNGPQMKKTSILTLGWQYSF